MTQPSGLRELEELLAKYESILAEECEGAAWMDYDGWHEEWLRRLTTAEEPLLAALPALIEIARAADTLQSEFAILPNTKSVMDLREALAKLESSNG